ncbi:MAG: type II toxin-antitoxin system VapC family toxin [Gammaproteobacteria bacterium]
MKPVFADTFYYLALLSPRDPAHARAVSITRRLRARLVTTAWVLMEVGDAMSLPRNRQLFAALLDGLKGNPKVTIVPLSQDYFDRGVDFFRQRPDKEWTLTDCISFLVMAEERLTDALTADRHFEQAGFKMLLK